MINEMLINTWVLELKGRLEQISNKEDSNHECYNICTVLECNTLQVYNEIANIVMKLNGKKVYDLGCCQGHQSIVFRDLGLSYVGVNDFHFPNFYGDGESNIVSYIPKKYPFKIQDNEKPLIAISNLCIGWLYSNPDDLKKQLLQIKKDFDYFVGVIPTTMVKIFENYLKLISIESTILKPEDFFEISVFETGRK